MALSRPTTFGANEATTPCPTRAGVSVCWRSSRISCQVYHVHPLYVAHYTFIHVLTIYFILKIRIIITTTPDAETIDVIYTFTMTIMYTSDENDTCETSEEN